ncbi:phospholipid phosphatase 5-like isoform X2 [Scylla paramamosain]|uniref:phospholipid phosphatase 5-like isoform X2 n=1 Tax=Scylla paramamosain TaxID=85552 RepID=UPI003083DEF3
MGRWAETHATFVLEIVTRAVLSVIFLELENASPFVRKIHRDELWLYKNPRTPSYVPNGLLWPLVFLVPTSIMLLYYLVKRDRTELTQGLLAFSLALGLNGVVTDIIKLFVVSFCSLGFLSLWICGKLGVFKPRRGQGWKLVMALVPLVVALMVALSRTTDYHHHWQDVLVGSMLGLLISYVCYRQYYPRLSSPHSHLSYLMVPSVLTPKQNGGTSRGSSHTQQYIDPESPMEEQVKWM